MRIPAITEAFNAELRKTEAVRKNEKAQQRPAAATDRSEFSDDGKRLSATRAQADMVAAQASIQPDVRPEKVAEAREKMEKGFYNSPELVDKLADKLLQEFGVRKPEEV